MSVRSSRAYAAPVPKMPPGLVELMEGLAKDVLKCNPTDVYSFCADHMKKLIEIRDGPKRELTLEQKIAIATKKIRQRAEQRRKDYDAKTQVQKQSGSHNESEILVEKGHSDSEQYNQNKIVMIPEEDLIGDVEHEISVKAKENSLSSESEKPKEMDSETTMSEMKAVDNDSPSAGNLKQNETNDDHPDENIDQKTDEGAIGATLENDTNEEENTQISAVKLLANIKSDGNDSSPLILQENNILEITVDKETDGQENNTNENDENNTETKLQESNIVDKRNYIPSCNENCLQLVIKNDDESQNASETFLKKEIELECITSANHYDKQKNPDIGTNVEKNGGQINNTETINVSIVDESDKTSINETNLQQDDSNTENTNDEDQTTLYCSINTDKENASKGSGKEDHIPLLLIPAVIPDEDDTNNSELQSNTMDLETAAITIQKVFRNFLFKNKTLSTDDATNVDINALIEDKDEKGDNKINMNVNKDRRTLGLSRMDTVLQTVNEEKSLSQSTDDSSTLSSAATIIQAHVRGFLVRNKFNANKNSSTTSGIDSDGLSFNSMEGDIENRKSKTILNIHIVPESGHFMSRDESVLTSVDLSLDGSPPCSTNLHPMSQDTYERRKQLKREDAFQSVSPPSNNSGKLSEDVDSVKEVLIDGDNHEGDNPPQKEIANKVTEYVNDLNDFNISTMVDNLDTALEVKSLGPFESPVKYMTDRPLSLPEMHSDEMDVITPFTPSEEKRPNDSNLIHSGEFHEVVLPTKVSRSDTSVVSDFQNALVYFLLWNNA